MNNSAGSRSCFMRSVERRPPRIVVFSGLAAALVACGDAGHGVDDLSPFAEDILSSGRVLENSTACVVDAVCHLRIEFADTTIVAVYGSGERPASDCASPRVASDVAFQVRDGDLVEVVLSSCGSGGHYLRRLARRRS